MQAFLIAMQFLTRIPLPSCPVWRDEYVGKSLNYYPLVGLIIGLGLFLSAWVSNHNEPLFQAALVLGAWVLLTGGLHLDGLSDCADAWVGGLGDRERTLKIMKDPYCGPAGVTSIVLVLLIKFAALSAILATPETLSLIFIPIIARLLPGLFVITTPCARTQGLGFTLTQHVQHKPLIYVSILCSCSLLIFAPYIAFLILFAALLTFLFIRRAAMQRLKGFTGDVLGATIEIFETTALIFIVLFG